MELIAKAWAEDLAHVTDAALAAAMKEYRRRYDYFPKGTKAVLELCAASQDRTILCLPHVPTADEFEYQAAMSRRLLERLEGNKMVRQ